MSVSFAIPDKTGRAFRSANVNKAPPFHERLCNDKLPPVNKILSPAFDLSLKEIKADLSIKPGSNSDAQIEKILNQVERIARPKALYRVAYIEKRGHETVMIDQTEFHSRALYANLETVGRVFPYIATCGTEVDGIPIEREDAVQRHWFNTIRLALLRASIQHLRKTIQDQYQLETHSAMNPGSGEAGVWPIEQQRALFSLLGGQQWIENTMGVHLLDSYLMTHEMTVSGILFPSKTTYYNCQLCRRDDCPGRQAHFDVALWENLQGK